MNETAPDGPGAADSGPGPSAVPVVRELGRVAAPDIDAVLHLVAVATEADGVSPLSEHVLLHLRGGGETPGVNLLVERDGDLLGYAHLDTTDAVAGAVAELVVAPTARRHGIGARLLDEVVARAPGGRLRLWAHGHHPAAAALAASHGMRQTRELWQLRRPLDKPLPDAVLPPGVTVRTFVVGQDEAAWTAVNNAAFATHPEQGNWSVTEIGLREQESWFDPSGFFLAERKGRLIGFHWTKVHGAEKSAAGHAHPPIGEVYVVGVAPEESGHGLGPALTLIGLHHLRSLGLAEAMLYVDESNTYAIKVYERLGFSNWDVDVSYSSG